MSNKITIKITQVYGKETIYPVDENARLFAQLVNQKTLTRTDLAVIGALGFQIEIEQATL